MSDPIQDISASQLLAKLEAEVTQKLQAIASIRLALGLPLWTGASGVVVTPNGEAREGAPGVIRSDEFFRMSIPEAIKKYLAIMRKPQYPKSIADGLKAGGLLSNATDFYANITTAIKRLDASGIVASTPNGWGLAEWYPSKPKSPDQPKKASRSRPFKKNASQHSPKPKPLSDYQRFMKDGRAAGKDLKQISQEWAAKKADANVTDRQAHS